MKETFNISAAARYLVGITNDDYTPTEVQLGAYQMWEMLTGTQSAEAADLAVKIAMGPQLTAKKAPF